LSATTIETIRNDLLALDFNQAEELGLATISGDYERLSTLAICYGANGKLYINNKHAFYPCIKQALIILNEVSTEDLVKIYKDLDSRFPDINSFQDANKYQDTEGKFNVYYKMLTKVELTKREEGLTIVQNLIKLLIH
jgi:hypothetical protein